MQLKPVTTTATAPEYPERRWRRPVWLRRVANVLTLSIALGLAACGGSDRDIDDNDWEHEELAGAEPEPLFWCGDEMPEYSMSLYAPGSFEGELCGEQTAWGRLEVAEQGVYRLSLDAGADRASVAVVDPSGHQVLQIDDEQPEVTAELEPGTWTLEVTANDPVEQGWGVFMITVEQI